MKVSNLKFLILSLSGVTAAFPYSVAHGALRVSNSSSIQNQVSSAAARSAVPAYEPQPARVVTNDNGETVAISSADMNTCSNIYPNGVFDWVKPTTGSQRGGPATCAALVELRSYRNTDYNVLASAYLAAGDRTKCNIDNFHDVTKFGQEFTYPADEAPTIEDVKAVMAEEQKANAGIKILAAAVVGGIGGNLVGKADAGSDSPIGTNKEKLVSTAIGAAGGAALMTASTQSNNYKVGSTIMSTGINAAAGAVAGNLLASGDDILKIDKCTIKTPGATQTTQQNTDNKDNANGGDKKPATSTGTETTCLYGAYDIGANNADASSTISANAFYDTANQKAYVCSGKDSNDINWEGCTITSLTQVTFKGVDDDKCKAAQSISGDCLTTVKGYKYTSLPRYKYDNGKIMSGSSGDGLIEIDSATKVGRHVGAMIVFTESQGAFGIKHSEWLAKYSSKYANGLVVYDLQGVPLKDSNGDPIVASVDNFYPNAQSADDGTMVDFGNRARAKSTMIGAGGGAALGALAGVSGATTEIQNRWATAVDEYKNSLRNVLCVTGTRPLGEYNAVIEIAPMPTTTEEQ